MRWGLVDQAHASGPGGAVALDLDRAATSTSTAAIPSSTRRAATNPLIPGQVGEPGIAPRSRSQPSRSGTCSAISSSRPSARQRTRRSLAPTVLPRWLPMVSTDSIAVRGMRRERSGTHWAKTSSVPLSASEPDPRTCQTRPSGPRGCGRRNGGRRGPAPASPTPARASVGSSFGAAGGRRPAGPAWPPRSPSRRPFAASSGRRLPRPGPGDAHSIRPMPRAHDVP